jgi:hypothetical protein
MVGHSTVGWTASSTHWQYPPDVICGPGLYGVVRGGLQVFWFVTMSSFQFGTAVSLDSQLFRQRLPFAVDQGFGLSIHQDFVRPGATEAFAGPLAGGVNAHLGAVIG